jgi:pilus assembly protein CpaB
LRRNNILILLFALVMGAVAAFLARAYVEGQSHASIPHATLVVAAAPLGFGTEITGNNVVEIPWLGEALPDGAFQSKQELLKGEARRVLATIERNEPVLQTKITGPGQRVSLANKLAEGKRAVTVRVDDVRGVAGFIMPDDRVDVVLIRPESGPTGNNSTYSEILLQYVKVLAIDQLINERRDQTQAWVAKAVTLEVSPEQAQKVLLATDLGKLSLILRQQGEAGLEASRRVTERDLGPAPPRIVAEAPITVKVTVGGDQYEVPRMK